jgi:hypothetical protein
MGWTRSNYNLHYVQVWKITMKSFCIMNICKGKYQWATTTYPLVQEKNAKNWQEFGASRTLTHSWLGRYNKYNLSGTQFGSSHTDKYEFTIWLSNITPNYLLWILCLYFFVLLGIELRALDLLDKHYHLNHTPSLIRSHNAGYFSSIFCSTREKKPRAFHMPS